MTQFPTSKTEEIWELRSALCLLPVSSSLPREVCWGKGVLDVVPQLLNRAQAIDDDNSAANELSGAAAGKSWLKGASLQSFAICVWVRALIFVFHPLLEVSGAVYLCSSWHAGILISARPGCWFSTQPNVASYGVRGWVWHLYGCVYICLESHFSPTWHCR